MMKKLAILLALALAFAACSSSPLGSEAVSAPHLEKRGAVTQLIVEGEPYLALACELKNSSSSSKEYMAPIWESLKGRGINTVIGSVSWEQVEPEEGCFDFSAVDDVIEGARKAGFKLVLIWFASWKNGITSYVPAWVQKDKERFFLAQSADGRELPILSTHCEAACEADARAFAATMRHIREVDAASQTVIMMQVENEVGLHGCTRDFSPAAQKAFEAPVPKDLMSWLTDNQSKLLPETFDALESKGFITQGGWADVFGSGDSADEFFMAWSYASYIDKVAEAGKAEYDIPMYVNAWIVQPTDKRPGDYPAGGPQAQCHDIWRATAPHIDFLSPDIYLPDYPSILDLYSRGGNPVFVPESKSGLVGAASAAYTFGHGGMGYSPFGLDASLESASNEPLFECYRVIGDISDLILKAQEDGCIGAAWLKGSDPEKVTGEILLGGWRLSCSLVSSGGRNGGAPTMLGGAYDSAASGYVLAIDEGDGNLLVLGANARVQFRPAEGEGIAGLAKVTELSSLNGELTTRRWLNGDEIQLRYDLLSCVDEGVSGQGLNFATSHSELLRVELYAY